MSLRQNIAIRAVTRNKGDVVAAAYELGLSPEDLWKALKRSALRFTKIEEQKAAATLAARAALGDLEAAKLVVQQITFGAVAELCTHESADVRNAAETVLDQLAPRG